MMKIFTTLLLVTLCILSCKEDNPMPDPPIISDPDVVDISSELLAPEDWEANLLDIKGRQIKIIDADFPTPQIGYILYEDNHLSKIDLATNTFEHLPLDVCEAHRICAPDAENIFVFIRTPESLGCPTVEGQVQFSDDGGQTWEGRSVPTNTTIYDAYFLDDKRGYLSVNDLTYQNNNLPLETFDGGMTWIRHDSLLLDMFDTVEPFFFLDESVGYIIGKDDLLYKTIDGGLTWESIFSADVLQKIYFLDKNEQIGFAIRSPDYDDIGSISLDKIGLFKTINGGSTWTKILSAQIDNFSAVSEERIMSIQSWSGFCPQSCPSLPRITASSDDGGISWNESEPFQIGPSMHLFFPEPETGVFFSGEEIYRLTYQP